MFAVADNLAGQLPVSDDAGAVGADPQREQEYVPAPVVEVAQ